MSDHHPGPLLPATIAAAGDRWVLVLQRSFAHPPAAVWAALVEPEQQAAWAPFRSDRDLGTPGPAMLTTVGGEGVERLPGDVRIADPPRLLEHVWDADLLRWELAPRAGGGTLLTLRHSFAEREMAPSYGAGWQICLDSLDALLDGHPRGPATGEAAKRWGWQALRDQYADLLEAGAPQR